MKKAQNISAEQIIYEMLIENTGIAMMDSGGENGRMWQRNQNKTLEDFKREPYATFEEQGGNEKDGWDISPTISVFHNLSEQLELDDLCEKFNILATFDEKWTQEEMYGTTQEQDDFLKSLLEQGASWNGEAWNTYNYDSPLSQVLQGRTLEINDQKYVILQIHGGADVRGGYTSARMFKLRTEFLYEDVTTSYGNDFYSNRERPTVMTNDDDSENLPKGDIKEILKEMTANAECPNY